MNCVTFADNEVTYSGAANGSIYKWHGNTLKEVIENAHTAAVNSMHASKAGYITGADDGTIRLWGPDFDALVSIDLRVTSVGYVIT